MCESIQDIVFIAGIGLLAVQAILNVSVLVKIIHIIELANRNYNLILNVREDMKDMKEER